ncbi:IS66 family insertion sequence element accessory protein TnpB [Dyadobacter pollutisoli]|uniref:IS66 family insertion sequence element accessory protein TnpB n=1 Tax=Dyadobacter pollutisoli TaxID=2910158 RepID=A0A9E8SN26_9BACT|nr:IS66 family insertion sequence element accessory protein TnpB [Dyadobacter pollutisoli]WAC13351.1 IS66 family insertion sequence element accessory protein TnpB [Dyadobacter pollutisoli]
MLSLSSSSRYFLYSQPADMRCGIYSLAGLVQNGLKLDPLSGDVFVFIGKRANQVRLLQWDGDGYALYTKRLEAGTFERPADKKLMISTRELMLILQGVKLKSVQLRKRYKQLSIH